MPKIIKYESQEQFKTDITGPRISPEIAGAATAEAGKLGPIMSEFGIKLAQIAGDQQQDAASAMALEKIYDIKLRADKESDLTKLSEYDQEINKVGAEAAKAITLPWARKSFTDTFAKTAITTKYTIHSDFQAKQIEQAQADLISFKENVQRILPGIRTEPERLALIAQVKDRIMAAAGNGTFDKTSAGNLWMDFRDNVEEGVINRSISDDPAGTAAELKKGKDGIYADMDEARRTDKIGMADAYAAKVEKDAELQASKIMNTNEDAVTMKYIDQLSGNVKANPIAESDLVRMAKNEEISPDFAKAMINTMRSDKTISAEDKTETIMALDNEIEDFPKKYGLIKMMMSPKEFADVSKFRAKVLNYAAKGYITTDTAQKYFNHTKAMFNWEFNDKYSKYQKKIKAFADVYFTPDGKAEVLKKFMDGVQTGMSMDAAMASAFDSQKTPSPYKIGDTIQTPAGARIVVGFDPDGEPLVKRAK